jgi:signal peptidase
LSGAFLLLVIALGVLVVVIPKMVGGIPLTVLTSSMIPHFPPGTLVIDRPIDPAELRIGDVATYQIVSGKPGVITHRIISISSSTDGTKTFQFKGDNNSVPDGEVVTSAQIQGEVWYSIPLLGYVNNAVNGPSRSAMVPAIAALLFAYTGYTIASAIVRARRGGVRRGSVRRGSARRGRRAAGRRAAVDPGAITAD